MLSSTGTGLLALAGRWTVRFIFGPSGLSPIRPTTRFMIAVPPRAAASVSAHVPGHLRCVRRHAAVDLVAVELEDLRPAHLEPLIGAGDALAARHDQGIGQRVGANLVLAVVRHVPGRLGEADRVALRVAAADERDVVGIPACPARASWDRSDAPSAFGLAPLCRWRRPPGSSEQRFEFASGSSVAWGFGC